MRPDQLRIQFTPPTPLAGSRPARPRNPTPPRLTLSINEAANALGVSRDHLERHILNDLRVIYSGRRRLIPITELQRWAEREAVAIPRPNRTVP